LPLPGGPRRRPSGRLRLLHLFRRFFFFVSARSWRSSKHGNGRLPQTSCASRAPVPHENSRFQPDLTGQGQGQTGA
jgi:hypothetical protein